jgi:hypothetical protein
MEREITDARVERLIAIIATKLARCMGYPSKDLVAVERLVEGAFTGNPPFYEWSVRNLFRQTFFPIISRLPVTGPDGEMRRELGLLGDEESFVAAFRRGGLIRRDAVLTR